MCTLKKPYNAHFDIECPRKPSQTKNLWRIFSRFLLSVPVLQQGCNATVREVAVQSYKRVEQDPSPSHIIEHIIGYSVALLSTAKSINARRTQVIMAECLLWAESSGFIVPFCHHCSVAMQIEQIGKNMAVFSSVNRAVQ